MPQDPRHEVYRCQTPERKRRGWVSIWRAPCLRERLRPRLGRARPCQVRMLRRLVPPLRGLSRQNPAFLGPLARPEIDWVVLFRPLRSGGPAGSLRLLRRCTSTVGHRSARFGGGGKCGGLGFAPLATGIVDGLAQSQTMARMIPCCANRRGKESSLSASSRGTTFVVAPPLRWRRPRCTARWRRPASALAVRAPSASREIRRPPCSGDSPCPPAVSSVCDCARRWGSPRPWQECWHGVQDALEERSWPAPR